MCNFLSVIQVDWIKLTQEGDKDGQLGAVLLVEFCIKGNSRSQVWEFPWVGQRERKATGYPWH